IRGGVQSKPRCPHPSPRQIRFHAAPGFFSRPRHAFLTPKNRDSLACPAAFHSAWPPGCPVPPRPLPPGRHHKVLSIPLQYPHQLLASPASISRAIFSFTSCRTSHRYFIASFLNTCARNVSESIPRLSSVCASCNSLENSPMSNSSSPVT